VDTEAPHVQLARECAVKLVPQPFCNTPVVVIVFYLTTVLGGPDVSNCICTCLNSACPSTLLVTCIDVPFNFAADIDGDYSSAIIHAGNKLSSTLQPVPKLVFDVYYAQP
jgi:hypothetical protein